MTPFVGEDLALLLACLREGSLTRAARTLGTTVSTVSRRLDRLETDVGRSLFHRNPDGLVPTPHADALRPVAEAAERAALDLAAAAAHTDDDVAGTVTVATTHDLAELVVVPSLPELYAAWPKLAVDLQTGPSLVDLGRREADLALRIGTPGSDDRMVVRRLRATPFAVFAADALRDLPLERLPWIAGGQGEAWERWAADRTGRGPALRVDELGLVRAAAAAGLGMTVLPDVYGHATPGLMLRHPLPELPPVPLFLVGHPSAVRGLARVRAVWEFLAALLGGEPGDDQRRLRPKLTRAYGWRFED